MKNILVILLLIIITPVFSQQSGSYSAGEGFILKEQNSIFFPSKRDRYLYWQSGEDERFDAPRSTIIFKDTIFKDSYNGEIFWLFKKEALYTFIYEEFVDDLNNAQFEYTENYPMNFLQNGSEEFTIEHQSGYDIISTIIRESGIIVGITKSEGQFKTNYFGFDISLNTLMFIFGEPDFYIVSENIDLNKRSESNSYYVSYRFDKSTLYFHFINDDLVDVTYIHDM